VKWVPPAKNGGSPVTSYTITIYKRSTATKTLTVTAPTTSATITGLTSGTAYTFTVGATNAAGTGPTSPMSSPTTPR
jgi:hypothetical protein